MSLISRGKRKFFWHLIHTLCHSLIIRPSPSREPWRAPGIRGGRRRRVGSATVALLGDEPLGPGLDRGSGGANAVPEVRQDAGGACGLRHITLKSEVRLHAPLPNFLPLILRCERSEPRRTIARRESGRGKGEVHPSSSILTFVTFRQHYRNKQCVKKAGGKVAYFPP